MYIITILAIFLYVFAPNTYSFSFCCLINLLYIFTVGYIYFRDKKIEFPSFHLFFSISFYGVCFVYPIFVYPINPDISLFKFSSYSYDVITKCTALAYLGYCIYGCGYIYGCKRTKYLKKKQEFILRSNFINRLLIATIIIFCLNILLGGFYYFANQYQGKNNEVSIFAKYLFLLLPSLMLLLAVCYQYCRTMKIRRKIVLLVVIINIILMMAGTRTLPLFSFITLGYSIILHHKIKKKYVVIVMVVGIFIMSLLGNIRKYSISFENMNEITVNNTATNVEFISDLYINNRNLYSGYDIVEKKGPTYGVSLLGNIFAVVPFLQSFISELFNIAPSEINSASLLTAWDLGENSTIGLGTNIVADVYLSFGIVGLLLFYFLGYIVVSSRSKMRQNSIVGTIIYLALVGDSVYICRGAILGDLRLIIWSIILFFLFRINKTTKSLCRIK